MRILQSSLLRAICAIVIGYLLVMYRTDMLQWMTIAAGGLFFISGLISVITYYVEKKRAERLAAKLATMSEMREENQLKSDSDDNEAAIQEVVKPTWPIVGLGSLILGIVLAAMPSSFEKGLMYVLAAILIMGAVNQIANLLSARKYCHVGLGFWLFPIVLLLVGIYMIVKPMEVIELSFRIIGWSLIVFGVAEAIIAILAYHGKRKFLKAQRQLEVSEVEDIEKVTEETSNDSPTENAEMKPTEDK